ncbi:DNA methyltransferase [Marinitoga sp. 1197]|uniref:Eco57I restriction-modification methylase domain-containing protein n=1 Tax=Marinitoga sp. 1197 TaxID=1428449 RepID=UPI000640F6A8|nr:DNA methyltransferase [Marinitoga sp. 1197]
MLKYKEKNLGQIFTPSHIVEKMVRLIRYGNNILEPAVGNGEFLKQLKNYKNIISIEIDRSFSFDIISENLPSIIFSDFFDYSIKNKFDTIIGNPPYVKYSNIIPETRKKLKKFNILFDGRTNLFLYFIYKSYLHLKEKGEIIFIVPRELFDLTSALRVNQLLHENGTFTHIYTFGDKKIFGKGFSPNVMIFRYEKGNMSHETIYNDEKRYQYCSKGFIYFIKEKNYSMHLSDIAYVKVGGVSGADEVFAHESGNIEVVCSYTQKTGKTKRMIYNTINDHLLKHKEKLLKRKIKKFDENNWWKWGRDFYISDRPRIYVNAKTRNKKPFFIHESKYYDGSILGIFPKNKNIDLVELRNMLNDLNWEELGFICDGRYIFTQKKLENVILPEDFQKFI